MTISWAIDPGGDIRPVALDVADAIDTRVAGEVNRHREYAVILGLNATETDARLDGVAVAMRERCLAWVLASSVSFARTMVLSETPLAFDPDEVETIMRATSREVDDRVLSAQVPHLRDHGDALASGLAAWLVRIDDEFKRIMQATAGLDNARREFALAVQAAKLPIAPMISIWTAKVDTARGWVDQQRRSDG